MAVTKAYGALIIAAVLAVHATLTHAAVVFPRVGGYTFQSDPSTWLLLALDTCAALSDPNVYSTGSNVVSTAGKIDSLEREVNATKLCPIPHDSPTNNNLAHLICDLGGELGMAGDLLRHPTAAARASRAS